MTISKAVRYQCVWGYFDAPRGRWSIGQEDKDLTIGPIQYIEEINKIPVQLRLTPEEYDMLQSQAQAKGLKLAAYLRSLIYEHVK